METIRNLMAAALVIWAAATGRAAELPESSATPPGVTCRRTASTEQANGARTSLL